jgi:pSer/pThr/pTyr-binding forkhead associated (FHA) protein
VRAKLFCRTGKLAGVDHEIDQQATIGRSTQNSLRLDAPLVSQTHARISYDASLDAFVLEDLDSKNGTRLDGVSVRGRQRLGPVHVVTLGEQHDFIFVAASSQAEASPRGHVTSDTLYEPPSALDVPVLFTPVADPSGNKTVHERASALEVPRLQSGPGRGAGVGEDAHPSSRETVLEAPSALEVPSLEMVSGVRAKAAGHAGQVVLEVTLADGATRRVVLGEGRHEIGRSAECAVSIDDRTLTRRHAVLTVTGDGVTLEDLDSRNGTFKSGERLTGRVSIRVGDVVTCGAQVRVRVVAS